MYPNRQPISPYASPVPVYSDSIAQPLYLNNQHPNAEPPYPTPMTRVFQMPLEDQYLASNGPLTQYSQSNFTEHSTPSSGYQSYFVECHSEVRPAEQSPTWNGHHTPLDGQPSQHFQSTSTENFSPSNRRQFLSNGDYSEPTLDYSYPTAQYVQSRLDERSYPDEEYRDDSSSDSSRSSDNTYAPRRVSQCGLPTKDLSYVVRKIRVGNSNVTCLLQRHIPDLLPRSFRSPPNGHIDPQSHHPTFEIRRAGDKGKGIFCLSPIPEGTLIFAEHPLVACAAGAPFEQLLEKLEDHVRDEVLSLSNTEQRNKLDGLINTNAMAIDLDSNSKAITHRALFSIASRCNHRYAA